MKKFLLLLCAAFLWVGGLHAQDLDALAAKLDEYVAALQGEPVAVQNAECDFLISSCEDSLVRQAVALRLYDHYLHSPVMGEEGVAVHLAEAWFIPGKVAMRNELDLLNAKVFVTFNRSSLLGQPAPVLVLSDEQGEPVRVPVAHRWTVLYFYDTSCSTCKVETARLRQFLTATDFPVVLAAVYVGSDEEQWSRYCRTSLDVPGALHVWDPAMASDFQRLYGVLQTPRLFLVSPDGVVTGRGLDTPALQTLLSRELGARASYVYGTAGQMDLLDRLFAAYPAPVSPEDVAEVAAYLSARTLGEGDAAAYRTVMGDLLYYLTSRPEEGFREATLPFIRSYIHGPSQVWTAPEDTAQVLSLAALTEQLLERTPVGSLLPDVRVRGLLRRAPRLWCSGQRRGRFSLRSVPADYLVFYTSGCGNCQQTLAAVEALLAEDRTLRVLLVDLDALPEAEARTLLDTLDLSMLPLVIRRGKDGTVLRRYVQP